MGYWLIISIHAPREGSDSALWAMTSLPKYFYPRSPRGERPQLPFPQQWQHPNFYPRSPRGERPPRRGDLTRAGKISIHAPREGSDRYLCYTIITARDFYPRSPRGERQWLAEHMDIATEISIHAPREGSDGYQTYQFFSQYISIHAPREGSDRTYDIYFNVNTIFLSTLPARGATRMVSGSV